MLDNNEADAVMWRIIGSIIYFVSFIIHLFNKKEQKKEEILDEIPDAAHSDNPEDTLNMFDKINKLVLIFGLLVISGCQPNIYLSTQDCIRIKQGQESIFWFDSDGTKHVGAPKNGKYFSDDVIEKIMKIRVENE